MNKDIESSVNFIDEIRSAFSTYATENQISVREIQLVGNLHNNFLSDVARIKIIGTQILNDGIVTEYNEAFIVKLLPQDEDYVNIYGCDIAFRNEKHAYVDIIPHINVYSRRPIPCPKYISVERSIESKIVILEDLNENGFYNFDKLTGFTEELVTSVLSELANLHAASFTMKQLNPELFNDLTSSVQEVLYRSDNSLLKTQEDSLDLLIEVLKRQKPQNSYYEEIVKNLKGKTEMLQIECLSQKGPFAVINHGDIWASNILRKSGDHKETSQQAGSKTKDDIKLIDFQIMRYTSFAADLNYFFYVNLPPKMRKENMDAYLRFYLSELIDCITDNRVRDEIQKKLTFDRVKEEMQNYSTFGFICGLWIFPVFYNAVTMVVKTTEAFMTQTAIPIEHKIEALKEEEIERLLGLVESYASSLEEKNMGNWKKTEETKKEAKASNYMGIDSEYGEENM